VDALAARPPGWRERAPSAHAGRADRPLFIGACPRSGTTLLRSLLNNHPDLAMPAETDFLLHLWAHRGRLGDLRDPARRRRLAEWIFDTPDRGGRRIRAGVFSRDEAVERVAAAPPTLGSVFAAVFGVFADAKGKPRWGDKRPGYAGHISTLFALFPHAQFINVVRDPRAATDSQMRAPWYRHLEQPALAASVATWEFAVARVDRFADQLCPDQLLDVRYEDLVREPQPTLERICAFAGLRGGEADQLRQVPHRHRVEAALALPGERDAAASVDGALDEEELARVLRPRPVDGARADERGRQGAVQQRLLELGLRRRIGRITGLRRRLRLGDRHGQPRQLAALTVERPAVVVGVDRSGRDDDEGTDEAVECVELLPVPAVHGDGVVDDVRAGAERGPQLRIVGPVGRDRLDAELEEPLGQRAGARDGDDFPAVLRQRARRGAADHARAADQHRPRH
jgi:hypothetical protein